MQQLIDLWPIISGLITAVMAIGVLFYRAKNNERRIKELDETMEARFRESFEQDRQDHTTMLAKIAAVEASQHHLEVTLTKNYVTREEFMHIINRIEDKLDRALEQRCPK